MIVCFMKLGIPLFMHICLECNDHLVGCSFLKFYFNYMYVYVCTYEHMSVCAQGAQGYETS